MQNCVAADTISMFQDHLVSGLCSSSGILTARRHNVSETGSVSFFTIGEGDTTLFDPLERANLSQRTMDQIHKSNNSECYTLLSEKRNSVA
jgi:hypothetical protein